MIEILNAIIVDDEEKSIRVLQNLVEKICPQVKIVASAEDIDTAFALINAHQPDLVFLDIQMPDGNAFDLLRRFETIPFDIIFVTSYDHYAINAIRFSAVDYLLKPVDLNELRNAANRALQKARNRVSNDKHIVNLLHNLEADSVEQKISVHHNETVVFISLSQITCIEAYDRYSYVHTIDNAKYMVSRTLKEFELFLQDIEMFIRISKNTILNINHIKEYTKGDPSIVTLKTGQSYEIARRKKQEILNRLKMKF
jgi:two-component system LytT family response regulator